MSKFSNVFGLNKSQAELDFVDIDLVDDTPLYIDPYALTTRDDTFSVVCHQHVVSFFKAVVNSLKQNNRHECISLLSHLGEPDETHLGVSQSGNKGRGIGSKQATEIFNALSKSKAAETGLLEDMSDFALFIPNIGRDKISDITTNIIRKSLVSYTQKQCELYNIPMQQVPSGLYWCMETLSWKQEYTKIPVHDGSKILLVPKFMVRYQVGVDHGTYRSKFVLEFLQEEHLKAGSALVTAIKDKKGNIIDRKVFKKDVSKVTPNDKDFLAQFSLKHPEVIEKYRDSLKELASKIPSIGDSSREAALARRLKEDLIQIPTGGDDALNYHNHCLSVISFLFFPNLIYPEKEREINDGRKRIDITYTNGKESGLFYRVSLDTKTIANTIHIECKNYTNDIKNPEIDQLIGRFDHHNRGCFGMLFFRNSNNMPRLISRCIDTAKQGAGIILPIDDTFIIECLELVENNRRVDIDRLLTSLYQQVIS